MNQGNAKKSKKKTTKKNIRNETNGEKKKTMNPPRRRSSGKEYLKEMNFQNINIANPLEFVNYTIKNMEEKIKTIMEDPCNTAKRDAIEDELKPMCVTHKVKERIRNIPRSKAVSWYIDVHSKVGTDETFQYCNIHLVDENNLLDRHESSSKLVACIGVSMCIIKNRMRGHSNSKDLMAKEKDLIMGTFAKTCSDPDSTIPLRGLYSGRSVLPAEIIFNTSGLVNKMKSDLMNLGVARVSIAYSGLIADGRQFFEKKMIDTRPCNSVTMSGQVLVDKHLNEEKEVSKDCMSSPHTTFAAHSEIQLCESWQINLRHAIENSDEKKVIEITSMHSAVEVRECCEISVLLQTMAGRGLKESCRLLLDYCSVSVEGVQAPDIKDEWWFYMRMFGHSGHSMTPLMVAACEGYYEVCELLLDRHADICAAEKSHQKNALHVAVAMGHRDVVKLLCKRNADISHVDDDGNDPIDIADYIIKNEIHGTTGCTVRQYERIAEILREHDRHRCSYCKNGAGLLRQCPCHKERYCDGDCQMQRWQCHRVLHKKVMKEKKR